MQNSIKRFYILPEVWGTVTNSQVFNWVEVVSKNSNIKTDCISLTGKKIDATRVKAIEEKINGNFYQFNAKIPFLGHLYVLIVFLKFYFKNVNSHDKILFQTRITMLGWVFTVLRFLPKVKLIFEARGATVEENEHVNQGINRGYKGKIRFFRLKLYEKKVITKSKAVICVSNALKTHYLDKYYNANTKLANKFFVFPGAADTHLFHYEKESRFKIREKLNYTDKDKVIIYSGKLSLKWEIPDVVFSFFSKLNKRGDNFKFLVLTPDQDLCKGFIDKYNLNDVVHVTRVSFEEVNSYLNAADMGLLLREDIPMNNVASPTKFSEYILSGLPTIISNGVYDYVELVEKTNFGVVLDDMNEVSDEEVKKINELLTIDRLGISNWGASNLSKDRYTKEYIDLLMNI